MTVTSIDLLFNASSLEPGVKKAQDILDQLPKSVRAMVTNANLEIDKLGNGLLTVTSRSVDSALKEVKRYTVEGNKVLFDANQKQNISLKMFDPKAFEADLNKVSAALQKKQDLITQANIRGQELERSFQVSHEEDVRKQAESLRKQQETSLAGSKAVLARNKVSSSVALDTSSLSPSELSKIQGAMNSYQKALTGTGDVNRTTEILGQSDLNQLSLRNTKLREAALAYLRLQAAVEGVAEAQQKLALQESASKQVSDITQSKQFGGGAIPSTAQPGQIASFENAKNTLANFAKSSQEHGKAVSQVFADMAAGQQKAYGAGTLESQASAKLQSMTRAYQDMGKAAWGAYSPIELIKHVIIFGYAYQLWYGFIASIKQGATDAQELAQRIAEIRTISQRAQLAPSAWGAGLTNISNQFGMDVIDVAKAAYETLSNQVAQGADTFDFLGKSALFAKTTVATNAEAVDLLTGAINAYGMKTTDVTRISAELFKTIDLGRVRASDMANSFGQVAIQAEQLGVSFEDMLGVISSGTRKGIKYDELATQLRGVMTALIKPSEAMKTALREMGADSAQAAVQMFGLPGVFDRLAKSTGGASEEMARLFPNVRGLRLFMGLAGDGATQLADDIKKIKYDSLTEYGVAANDMMNSQAVKVAQLNTEFKNYFIGIGDYINKAKAVTQETIGGTNAVSGMAHTVIDLGLAWAGMKAFSAVGGLGIGKTLSDSFLSSKMYIEESRKASLLYANQLPTLERGFRTTAAGVRGFATELMGARVAAMALNAVKFAGFMLAIEEVMHLISEFNRKTLDPHEAIANSKGFDTSILIQQNEKKYGTLIDEIDRKNKEVGAKYGELKGEIQKEISALGKVLSNENDSISKVTGGKYTSEGLSKVLPAKEVEALSKTFSSVDSIILKNKEDLQSFKEQLTDIMSKSSLGDPLLTGFDKIHNKIEELKKGLSLTLDVNTKGFNAGDEKAFSAIGKSFKELMAVYGAQSESAASKINAARTGGSTDLEVEMWKEELLVAKEGQAKLLNQYNAYVPALQGATDRVIAVKEKEIELQKKSKTLTDQMQADLANKKALSENSVALKENEANRIEAATKTMQDLAGGSKVAESALFHPIPFSDSAAMDTAGRTEIRRFQAEVELLRNTIGEKPITLPLKMDWVTPKLNINNTDRLLDISNPLLKTKDLTEAYGELYNAGVKAAAAFPVGSDSNNKLLEVANTARKAGEEYKKLSEKGETLKKKQEELSAVVAKEDASTVKQAQDRLWGGITGAVDVAKSGMGPLKDYLKQNVPNVLFGADLSKTQEEFDKFKESVTSEDLLQPVKSIPQTTDQTAEKRLQEAQAAVQQEQERKQAFALQQEQFQYQEQVNSINARAAALQETIKHESTLLGITKEQTRLMETQNRLSKDQSANSDKIALLQLQSKLYGVDNTKEIEHLQYKSDKAQEEALKNKIDSQGTSDELARKQAAEELRASEVARQNQSRQQAEEAARIQNDKVKLNEEQRNKQSQLAGQAAAQNIPQDETFKNTIASFGVLDTAIINTANYLNQMSGQPQQVVQAPLQQAAQQQAAQQQQQAAQALGEAAQQQEQAANSFNAYQRGQVSITGGYQYGGMVKYFANGGPTGTDTIPAYLTPGEYVVNARAAAQNRAMLDHINFGIRPMTNSSNSSSKTQYFNTGGVAVNISNNGSNGVSRSQALNIGNTIAGELKRGTLKFAR